MGESQSGEVDDLKLILLDDMAASFKRLEDNHPRHRRECIRAIFAAVEGNLAALTDDLLSKADNELTEGERMALREETYRVTDSGKLVTTSAHMPLKVRVKLVTGILSRLHPEYAIDFGSAGWQSLLAGVDVRDRITHPKKRQDMNVEQEELDTSINGVFWFLTKVIQSGHEGIAAYLARHRGSQLPSFVRAAMDSIWAEADTARSRPDSKSSDQVEGEGPTETTVPNP